MRDPLGWLGATIDGRLELVEIVGEGGYGVVYRATHLGFDETVAVKCLKVPASLHEMERESFLRDFRAEARLLHRLSRKSAGIVQALDVGAATSPRGIWTPYISMEWLDGKNLERDIADRALRGQARRSLSEAVALLTPVAEALAVTHGERIAHLDVKPANIFLERDSDKSKLLDFGIAKVLNTSDTMTVAFTRTGARPPFTPAYAAPEQFDRRHGATGPWSDVYALALIFIEICSGEPALVGDTPVELYVAAANEQYRPSLASHGVRASAELEAVVKTALSVDPRKRFPDAAAMWSALRQALGSPLASPRASDTPAGVAVSRTEGLNRVCTILFADLVGLEEGRDPERWSELVKRYMTALESAVAALEGTVEQTVGESMMAVFGLYDDSASAAERAVLAALRMQPALMNVTAPRRKDVSVTVRVGMSTGRVFARAREASGRFQLLATGAPVKLAAQLSQTAPPGAVLVDRDTYRQVAGLFDMHASEGGTTPPKAYRVNGPARDRHALHAGALREFCGLSTVLAGRAAEMEALAAAQDLATSESRPRLVTLLGAPGTGKSRLLIEVADRLEQDAWILLAGGCSAIGMRTSYALAASLLRARFHIHEDDAPEVAEGKLRRGVRSLRDTSVDPMADLDSSFDPDDTVAQLLRLLGVHRQDDLGVEEEGAERRLRIAGAVASLLRLADKPIAIVCDDLQWADEASLTLLEDLCTRLGDRPLLIVTAARSELLERRPSWGEDQSLHLSVEARPLARRALEQMIRDRLRNVETLPDELVKRLVEHAEGSPLTLVETLHLLIDAGVIDTGAEPWRVHVDRLGVLTLPASVHGIVQARLDRLDETSRLLVARAAVVGRAFWDGVLTELAGGVANLRRALMELRDRGILQARSSSTFPDEQEYVFCDSATQRVAYAMLAHKERRELHRRVARWLEQRLPSDAGAARVAEHYECAAAPREAVLAHRRAGAYAASLGQNADALECYERACAIDDWMNGEATESFEPWSQAAPGDALPWSERVALRAELGNVWRRMGEFDRAEQQYQRAAERIAGGEDASRWRARLDYRRAVVEKLRGRIDEAIVLLEGALSEGGLAEERAEMFALCASLMRRRQRLAECRAACLQGLRVCRPVAERGERWREALSKILNTLGSLFFMQENLVRAERCYLQAARAVDERRTPGQASEALNNLAAVRYTRGDLAGARECFQRVIRLAERSGDLWVRMTALANVGEVELAAERASVAQSCLAEAVRLGERIKAHLDLPEVYRNLARAELRLGEAEKALAAARRALELVRLSQSRLYLESVGASVVEVCAAVAASHPELAVRAGALECELAQTTEMLADVDG